MVGRLVGDKGVGDVPGPSNQDVNGRGRGPI